MTIGDAWVKQARSAVLELPSVIIPGESNFLLNTSHPDFRTTLKLERPDPGQWRKKS